MMTPTELREICIETISDVVYEYVCYEGEEPDDAYVMRVMGELSAAGIDTSCYSRAWIRRECERLTLAELVAIVDGAA